MNKKVEAIIRESKDGSYVHIQKFENSYIVNYTEPTWKITAPQDAFETLEEALGLVEKLLQEHPGAGFDGSNCLTE